MLLTLTTTRKPATDLGYLLRKNPARVQTFELSFGAAHVYYPEAAEERCTAALLLEIDPVGLVRKGGAASGARSLEQYVNDRAYAASSFLSVAIAEIYGTALSGAESKDRPGLAMQELPLEATLAAVPCRGGESFLRRLFEPLGYMVIVEGMPLDETRPEWGESAYYFVKITGTVQLSTLLSHLYVLVPVLDNEKHYWVGDDEVEKLLRHGEGWLGEHPEKETITRRYLKHRPNLVDEALGRLAEGLPEPESELIATEVGEEKLEERISLNEQRHGAVLAALRGLGARRVLDLGCGEGRLLRTLVKDKAFEEVLGVDVSHRVLEMAQARLERLPPMLAKRARLLHGSLTYRDERLAGFDAAAVVEVIEHLDPPRLASFERALFEFARPGAVVLTTPNSEYNVKWETLPAGKFRHRDHRFEWTRTEMRGWAESVAQRFGYTVRFLPVGPEDALVGPPTQMAVFQRETGITPGSGAEGAH